MIVIKNNGEAVEFQAQNLKDSLRKSGAQAFEVETIYQEIEKILHDGITTKLIYDTAYKLLKEIRKSYASKYSLKKALSDLGPTGFYFEKWICHILRYLGYQSETGHVLQGKAVTHEIDVLAMRDNEVLIAECKLRNASEAKISVTTPMYYLSRVNDLRGQRFKCFGSEYSISDGWLITNAYFTQDSIQFAEYYGLKLLAWDYPKKSSLRHLADDSHLYPITCLTELSSSQIKLLLDKEIILVQDIIAQKDLVKKIIHKPETFHALIEEVQDLIEIDPNELAPAY